MMQNRFNFRAALKTENFAIIVPVESVETYFYTMRFELIKDIFEKNTQKTLLMILLMT